MESVESVEIRTRAKGSRGVFSCWLTVAPLGGRDAFSLARIIVVGLTYLLPQVEFALYRQGERLDDLMAGLAARDRAGSVR